MYLLPSMLHCKKDQEYFITSLIPFSLRHRRSRYHRQKNMCKLKLPLVHNPFMLPIILASLIALLVPYVTKRNNKGAKGNPCLTHLPSLKKVDATSFIITKKDNVITHGIIHCINEIQNPTLHNQASLHSWPPFPIQMLKPC